MVEEFEVCILLKIQVMVEILKMSTLVQVTGSICYAEHWYWAHRLTYMPTKVLKRSIHRNPVPVPGHGQVRKQIQLIDSWNTPFEPISPTHI